MRRRFVVWRGTDEWRAEAATVELTGSALLASGTQIGPDYRIDYWLDATGEGFATRRLIVHASDGRGNRELDLTPDRMGAATDCDLAFSPLTNAMPVLRHALHRETGGREFTMAWVSVPDLSVTESRQRYEHVRPGVVRFVEVDGDFTADLELDDDGLVVAYPGLAVRA